MGISTLASYCGAQIFEAIGLNQEFIDRFFTHTTSRVGGVGIDVIAKESVPAPRARVRPAAGRRRRAQPGRRIPVAPGRRVSPVQPRHGLQAAARDAQRPVLDLQGVHARGRSAEPASRDAARPVPAEAGGAGRSRSTRSSRSRRSSSASRPARCRTDRSAGEAHETLAIAMNRMGGKSNTGEGGEDPRALRARCQRRLAAQRAVKQVASARFGVTSEYLVNADDLQIKMAQGAKPGEGGQLPGHKVYPWIAKVRYSTPGVGLISPPPHHDIYSIEDLAQLIYDLKNAEPARAHPREAGRRGRRRHGRGRRREGALRRRAHLRPRRRHRRVAAHQHQARGAAVGARARRDAAGARPQQAARPHRRAGGRPDEDRPRRDHRRRCSAPRSSASRPRRWSSWAA